MHQPVKLTFDDTYITTLMKDLSLERTIFHSEADFQHALACYIHKKMPDWQVRLEFKPIKDKKIYLDIWIRDRDRRIAIELKYKTLKLDLMLAVSPLHSAIKGHKTTADTTSSRISSGWSKW